jgi:biopolymer transport protein ExbB/TolQ
VRYDIEIVQLACERAASLLRKKMGRGRASLATIAASAPLVGFFGTVIGMASVGAFEGERSAIIAGVCSGFSKAMVPAGAGILIAIFAWCGYRYICAQVETIDIEMRAASLDLANQLSLLRQSH